MSIKIHLDFVKAIKEEIKKIGLNNVIVDHRMFAKDGKVYIVRVGIKVDKTVDAAVIGGIPGML